jgi:hypothetical protein
MTIREFYEALQAAATVRHVEDALAAFENEHSGPVAWVPLGGRDNNRGAVEVSADPGRSVVERLTNGIDAVLEAEHERHNGLPDCRSPKEAATAWLNVPDAGLSEMTAGQRRSLAQRVSVHLLEGEGKDSRTIEVRDRGLGLRPEEIPDTILSLNASNKLQKHYLAGIYGQGGSSTFAVSKHTLIASRSGEHGSVGFTVVRFLDLPPEDFKTGHYVYMTFAGAVLRVELPMEEFESGTQVKHFGFDLSSYGSPVGPNSLYGLLNRILFDPVLPVWLDSRLHNYRRVIKGSRNALNGAVDEGDEERRGPPLSHHVPIFYVSLGDFGRIGIEYWVLERPTRENKNPIAAFVHPSKPIVLTLQGQNHAELFRSLIKNDVQLPFLTQRLICHIDCNSLTPTAKRVLFVSSREDARRGIVYNLIQQELVKALKSDDELVRLNNEARELNMQERDEAAVQQMRSEVARLLRIHGLTLAEAFGGSSPGGGIGPFPPRPPRPPRPQPRPLEIHDPPTYIRILWDEHEPVTFYPEQRRYLRIETDANSSYHRPDDPSASHVNIIVTGTGLIRCGSTPLQGGRMRAIFEASADAVVGSTGLLRVELSRPALPILSDERPFQIIERPPARPSDRRVNLPPFDVRPVPGPESPVWSQLGWPDNPNAVASAAIQEDGTLVVYYSTVFPKYANQRDAFERREPALANSFASRYEIWLAVHSLLLYQDQQQAAANEPSGPRPGEEDPELIEARERLERCRIATMAVLFATRELQLPLHDPTSPAG